MPDYFALPREDQREALLVVAERLGRPLHLLEKDVWVVWALHHLFTGPHAQHLVFKSGTSLSKAYGVIRRFSEDVDLTYNIRAIAPDAEPFDVLLQRCRALALNVNAAVLGAA